MAKSMWAPYWKRLSGSFLSAKKKKNELTSFGQDLAMAAAMKCSVFLCMFDRVCTPYPLIGLNQIFC